MIPLFSWHDGPTGEVLLCRALWRALHATGRVDLVLGTSRDDANLLADLAGPHCRLAVAEFANTPWGAVAGLSHLRPDTHLPLPVWCGADDEFPTWQWPDLVDSLERQLRALGIEPPVLERDAVPMLDFAATVPLPELRRPSIWLDPVRGAPDALDAREGWFVLDGSRVAAALPHFDLLHAGPLPERAANLVDVSALSPIACSKLSERCVALVGVRQDRLALTLTEANRFKPRALCGYDARLHAPRWDYPGNPLELLATNDDLIDHLLAATAGAGT